MMLVHPVNTSYIVLPAREVHRMAMESIVDIKRMRRERVEAALDEAENETKTQLCGLYRRKTYPSRSVAFELSPEVQAAKQFANYDYMTCDLLKKAAQHLLDNDKLTEEQRVIQVSLNDFRALT